MHRLLAAVAILVSVLTTGCAGGSDTRSTHPAPSTRWTPPARVTWQWQLSGPLDLRVEAAVYDVDLFTTTPAQVAALHRAGRRTICYLDAGSFERDRPDSRAYPAEVLGRPLADFPDERWLDVRRLDLLGPILAHRMDLCRAKGFDAVEPDNVDGYANATGFPLTAADQLRFNTAVAQLAHDRRLAVGLKNDLDQVPALQPVYDFAVDEECVQYDECAQLVPFVRAHKPVLHVEYALAPDRFCPVTRALGFSSLKKSVALDATRIAC